VLRVLIVEDEPLLSQTLKHLIELNPMHEVTDIAVDSMEALASADERRPDLALVDLQLAHGSSGFSVAARLGEMGVPCLFTTAKAPSVPVPDLALGCLMKPFSHEDLVRALKTAEDIIRGRERLRPSRPDNLRLYAEEYSIADPSPSVILPDTAPPPPARRTVRDRVARFWRH
jgi:two-component system, response regulator PdtaR